ncbi:hypothetical protein HPB48_007130 [Haemaphysalis longicornis]|uniref:Uncharacterized protein n=1 Tax=Haemaphysalis longicornis TaxID=44386 RepID=A0A9J6GVZ3_HAELO|nr:hypothetical protein HPB48_007130 [Haemaphysalis longicornis]
MRDLSLGLGPIPGDNHAMYPDNITIWSRRGSEAQTKEMLQTALEITEECLQDTGENCRRASRYSSYTNLTVRAERDNRTQIRQPSS